MSFKKTLQEGKFVVTTDMVPPKGTDAESKLANLERIKGIVHGVNAPDMPGARLRAGSLAMSVKVKERGLEPILQITCRDRNRLSLQSELLSAHFLGIDNVLVLRGDGMEQTDQPGAKAVFDLDAPTLLRAGRAMGQGLDLAGNPLPEKPTFCLGAALDPGNADREGEISKAWRKVEAGAEFFQTQPVFAAEDLAGFLQKAGRLGVPVLGGIFLLASAKMAHFFNSNVPGITVPEWMIARLEKEDPVSASLELAVGLVRDLKEMCAGVHIMMITDWYQHLPEILTRAGVASA